MQRSDAVDLDVGAVDKPEPVAVVLAGNHSGSDETAAAEAVRDAVAVVLPTGAVDVELTVLLGDCRDEAGEGEARP